MITLGSSFDGQAGAGAGGLDSLTRWVSDLPGAGAKARASAIGSVGYNLKKTLKETVNGNVANWPKLSVVTARIRTAPPTIPMKGTTHHSRAEWESFRQQEREQAAFIKTTKKLVFWGSLAALAVYSVAEDGTSTLFGFKAGTFGMKTKKWKVWNEGNPVWHTKRVANEIGEGVVGLARLLTEGSQSVVIGGEWRTVNRQMQKYLRAIGLFSPKIGTRMDVPPRPLIGPHYLRMRPEIPKVFREKFWASFARKMSPGEAWLLTAADAAQAVN